MIEIVDIEKCNFRRNGFVILRWSPDTNKPISIINPDILKGKYKIDNITGCIEFEQEDVGKSVDISYTPLLPKVHSLTTTSSFKKDNTIKGNKSVYYVIANDEKVIAKVNEYWVAYEIMEKLNERFDDIKVCKIL